MPDALRGRSAASSGGQVTLPQLTLVPVLRLFNTIGLTGTTLAVWLYQVGFGVPFGVFLLYGFFASVLAEILEAAALDGAGEFAIFRRIVLPTPLLFLGGDSGDAPFTVQIAGLLQSTGQGQETLAAAALISVVPPPAVLLFLQRYFVRGVLGGPNPPQRLADAIHGAWVAFVHDLDPGQDWPPCTQQRSTMLWDTHSHVSVDPLRPKREIWAPDQA
jgi:hypothetical protein